MTLQKNRHRQEKRRRVLSALLKVGLLGALLVVTSFYSYRVGIELARRDLGDLGAQVAGLTAAADASRAEAARLRTALEDTRREAERYRQLAEQAPAGDDARELMRLVQAKLGAGLAKDRLATYIAAAAAPKKCAEPVTRRFVPRVRGVRGDNLTARLADGTVLSASGVPARDSAGREEHWYDPAQPVTFVMTEPGGSQTEATGVLPLEHMLVVRGGEYRFTVTAGSRGFVNVVVDRCEAAGG